MASDRPVITGTGGVARRAGMSRALLQYRLDRGDLPGPSVVVAGRRLFTETDVQQILAVLRDRPELRAGRGARRKEDGHAPA